MKISFIAPPHIFDLGNIFEPAVLHAQGLEYHGIGRTLIH